MVNLMALFLCFAWVIFISKTIRSLSAWTWAYARFICMASLRRSNLCELKFMLNAVILCYNNPRKSRPSKTGWCPKSCCDYGLFTSNLLDITMARVSNSGRGVGVSMGLGHPGAACPLTLTCFSKLTQAKRASKLFDSLLTHSTSSPRQWQTM